MDEKQFKELMKSMKSLESKLDKLIIFAKASVPKPKVSPEENKILKLCNKKNSIDDMMKKTRKTRTNVKFILSQLRKKRYIESIKIKNKLVYRRI